MLVIALCTACFSRYKISKKLFPPILCYFHIFVVHTVFLILVNTEITLFVSCQYFYFAAKIMQKSSF